MKSVSQIWRDMLSYHIPNDTPNAWELLDLDVNHNLSMNVLLKREIW